MASGSLSLEDLATEFQREGFIVLRKYYDHATVENCLKRIDEYKSDLDGSGRLLYTESVHGQSQLCRIENFALQDSFMTDSILTPLSKVVDAVMGEPMILFKDKVNFKLSGGAGFTPHQDGPAFIFDADYVSVSIAVDPSTLENGCLWLAPGEHKNGPLPHPKGRLEEETVKKMRFIPVPMEPGDVMIFHNHMPHYSEANNSSRSRIIVYLTFSTAKNGDLRQAYYTDKLEKFPPKHLRDPTKDYSAGAAVYNLSNPIE